MESLCQCSHASVLVLRPGNISYLLSSSVVLFSFSYFLLVSCDSSATLVLVFCCHQFQFFGPFLVFWTNPIFCLLFTFHSRSHLIRIANVTVGCFYLIFCFALSALLHFSLLRRSIPDVIPIQSRSIPVGKLL